MFSFRTRCMLLIGSITLATTAFAEPTTIFFETPTLGPSHRMIIDPYVAGGVTFTAVGGGSFDAVIGLVWNGITSACVGTAYDNQVLGTGIRNSSFGDGGIGLGAFPIRADLPPGIQVVSAYFQCRAGIEVQLRLYDASGALVASASEIAGPPDLSCEPLRPTARIAVMAVADEPAAYAILEVEPNYVFVIDNFSIDSWDPTPTAPTSWGQIKTLYR